MAADVAYAHAVADSLAPADPRMVVLLEAAEPLAALAFAVLPAGVHSCGACDKYHPVVECNGYT